MWVNTVPSPEIRRIRSFTRPGTLMDMSSRTIVVAFSGFTNTFEQRRLSSPEYEHKV
jgi:hypothetical protein